MSRGSAVASQAGRALVARGHEVRSAGLRLVAPVRQRAKRAPFVVVLLTVLGVGLVGLIIMSTIMQSQSFVLSDLTRENESLGIEREGLARELQDLQSPQSLADKATNAGMVPPANPVFLRLADGTVIGQPIPAGEGGQ
ncbi:hypothetical protein JL108_12785 [Aeromicrobium sp. YIM 150415]|uniref:Septum formation initiator family protein n=1 Tax=Aeromicrobium piscarium TaxID=2590901 RepID=A0A554S9S0_9ACTN|nr:MULTISPECIES: septum formation initiator family protein [Aeromicrobium]MBM9464330.1 hypothetical protein [Aeromicrobium sp. YIM 150415]TSD63073.1 septum formation initiator family protein [Aeromicrobium piscarium]